MIDIGIVLDDRSATQQLRLSIDGNAPATELYELIGRRLHRDPASFALRVARTGRVVSDQGDVASLRLLHGDRLVVGGDAHLRTQAGFDPVEVSVLSGPHAGAHFTVTGQVIEVGRHRECAVPLVRDDACSRKHARIERTVAGLAVIDHGSTNGTLVNGVKVPGRQVLRPGDVVTVGETSLAITSRTPVTAQAHLRYEDGHLLINRTARMRRRRPDTRIEIPAPPERPARRGIPKMAILGPVLLAVPMYAFTRSPLTLIMVVATPLLAVFSWFDDRNSGRSSYNKKAADYRAELERIEQGANEANARSGAWRVERTPPAFEILRRATDHSPELWQRDINDDDFLELRVGTADQASLVSVAAPPSGEPELRELAARISATCTVDRAAPVVIPIGRTFDPTGREKPTSAGDPGSIVDVVGIVGPQFAVADVARWLVTQLVVQHSPQDLAVAVLAPNSQKAWAWTRWLPHVEQLAGDDAADVMVGLDDASAARLFKALRGYADNRADATRDALAGAVRYRPHVTAVIELPLRVPEAEATAFLERLPAANMSVVLLAADRRVLPRHTDVIVAVDEGGRADVEFVRADVEFVGVSAERLDLPAVEQVATALAPVRDASTPLGAGASIPARVNLLEMLGLVPLTVDAVLARWSAPPKGVQAAIGVDASGPLVLELTPHGLVGGTTGAGKSELLQTYVASLALAYPPERLNFVFVDFKGGLAFNQCIDLPHQVGLITNLDPHLAERVMKSLQAELDERTKIINSLGGGDLASLAKRFPDRCPPELVIVFDEFREAVERVPSRPGEPSFIDRVMSLARLGRQVGMHVILATQTPEGVVTEDLKNNIDVRIALRVRTTEASRSIIGRPDAALITKRTPGRGFAEVEAGVVKEFQSAYVGATSKVEAAALPASSLETFILDKPTLERHLDMKAVALEPGATDLQVIVETASEAGRRRGSRPSRQPWLPELPPVLPLDDVLAGADLPDGKLVLPLARCDDPARQYQGIHTVDLERAGSMIVFGGTGAGKTTVLRSLAAVAALRYSPESLHLFALDFTGQGLGALGSLPHCSAAVSGREVDRVRQVVTYLKSLVAQRLELIDAAGVGSLAELNETRDEQLPVLLLLLDGFAAFYEQYADQHTDTLYDDVVDLMTNSRAAGLHAVVTANRSGLPATVVNAVPLRLVMRMNNPDEYSNLDVRQMTQLTAVPPGRAFTPAGLELQVGVVTPAGAQSAQQTIEVGAQNAGLHEIASRVRERWGAFEAPRLRTLPKSFAATELPPAMLGSRRMALAVDEMLVKPVVLDLDRSPTFLVAGPEESGKTNALAVLAQQFATAWPQGERHLLTGRSSKIATHDGFWTATHIGPDAAAPALAELKTVIQQRSRSGYEQPLLLLIDDADVFGDGALRAPLDETHLAWREAGLIVVVAMSTFAAGKCYAPWFKLMAAAKHGLLLMPDLAADGSIFDRRLPNRTRLEAVPGRGFLLTRAGYTLVQVARSGWPEIGGAGES